MEDEVARGVHAFGKHIAMILAAAVSAGGCLVAFPVLADEHEHETREERQQERGELMRLQSKARAESRLGYDYVYGDTYGRYIDFYVLNQQITRLSALLEAMKAAPGLGRAAPFMPAPPPGWATTGGGAQPDVTTIYGPDGPTVKSVRLLLEYRLLVTGNPRLVVGDVSEDKDAIRAQVATTGGALVEEYTINKVSGVWTPVR